MKKTLVKLVSVIGGEVLLRAASFLAVVVIARVYGAVSLGIYATVIAFVTVAVMVAENGLQISSITEMSRSRSELSSVVSQYVALRLFLFVLLTGVLVVLGLTQHWSIETWSIGALIALRVMLYSYSQLQFAVLKSLDRMLLIGPIQLANCTVLVFGIIGCYWFRWSFSILLWWFVIAQLVEIVLALAVLVRSGLRPTKFPVAACWKRLKDSTPVGLTYALAGATMRTDVIVLSLLAGTAEVGHFAAAQMGIALVYSLSWLFGTVLLAELSPLHASAVEFEKYVTRWTRILLAIAVPGAFLGYRLAPPVFRFLYGPEFSSTGAYAAMMVLGIPFILLNSVYFARAIALHQVRVFLGTYAATAVLAVALDLLLGRQFGSMGISVAVTAREIVMFALFKAWRTPVPTPTDAAQAPYLEAVTDAVSIGAQ